MRIGITYDLKDDYLKRGFTPEAAAEFDSDLTIRGIEAALHAEGQQTDRIGGITDLVSRLADGDSWDMVFNIAEGAQGLGREAQVPALLDAWGIPYTFSGPELMSLTLHKAMTNAVVRSMGVLTADYALVREFMDIERVSLPYPLFAKPVAEGTSKGISSRSLITNHVELRDACEHLLTAFHQPVLVETYLPGREFTVGLVGSGANSCVAGVLEVDAVNGGDATAYTYENKQQWRERVRYFLANDSIAEKVGQLALRAWRGLGCLDAGRVDIRLDENGTPRFMEINPLPGLNPESSDLPILWQLGGGEYDRLIQSILHSAMKRMAPLSQRSCLA